METNEFYDLPNVKFYALENKSNETKGARSEQQWRQMNCMTLIKIGRMSNVILMKYNHILR